MGYTWVQDPALTCKNIISPARLSDVCAVSGVYEAAQDQQWCQKEQRPSHGRILWRVLQLRWMNAKKNQNTEKLHLKLSMKAIYNILYTSPPVFLYSGLD